MASYLDMCRFVPVAGGLGDWEVASAVQGYLDDIGSSAEDQIPYHAHAQSADQQQWEISTGIYDLATRTFRRTRIDYGSNGPGVPVDFTAIPEVGIVLLKEDIARAYTGNLAPTLYAPDDSFYVQRSNQDFWVRESGVWVRKGNIRDEGTDGIVTITPIVDMGMTMQARVDRIIAIASDMDFGYFQDTGDLIRTRFLTPGAMGLGYSQANAVNRVKQITTAMSLGYVQANVINELPVEQIVADFDFGMDMEADVFPLIRVIAADMVLGYSQASPLTRTKFLSASMGLGFNEAATLQREKLVSAAMAYGYSETAAIQRRKQLTAAHTYGYAQASVVTHQAQSPSLLVMAGVTTPFMTVYDSSLVKVTKTWTTPAGNLTCVAISPDKRWIAVGGSTSPFLQIYDTGTGVPVLVTGVTFSGLTSVSHVAFTKDSSTLLVLDVTTPFLYAYSTSGWGSLIGAGITRPTGLANTAALTVHPDGTKYAIGFNASPWMVEYNLAAGTPVGVLPTGSAFVRGLSYNTVDTGGTNYLAYEWNGPTFAWYNANTGVTLTNPANPTAGNPTHLQHSVRMNADGTKCLVAGSAAVTEYRIITRSGTTLSNATLGTVPTDPIRGGVWSKDGTKLIAFVTGPNGNFMYSYDASTLVKDATNANQPPGAVNAADCSW